MEADGAIRTAVCKVLTLNSWALSVTVSIIFELESRIWSQNYLNFSIFSMDALCGDIFWIALFLAQMLYVVWFFFSRSILTYMGVNLTPHFVLNNLLHSLFVSLLAYSHFIAAEVVLLANFINLTCLYFRFNTYPRFFHLPVITGPLAWTFVAIYWNGAFIVPQENPVGQVIGGIFIWSILAYGMFLLLAYKDLTAGVALGTLSAAVCVAQRKHSTVTIRWISPLLIAIILYATALVTALALYAQARSLPKTSDDDTSTDNFCVKDSTGGKV